jgi:hypothetical protein
MTDLGTRLGTIRQGENPANHILISTGSESQVDLIGNESIPDAEIELFEYLPGQQYRPDLMMKDGQPLRLNNAIVP